MDEASPNTIGDDEAWEVLRTYERLFGAQDVEEIMKGFADDAEVTFADLPPMKGKAEIESFLRSRFARQEGYRLKKTLRAVNGNLIVGTWTGSWRDSVTGKEMLGRGTELIALNDGLCTRWEATFNMWEKEGGPTSPLLADVE